MFCDQCEQTAKGTGCTAQGVCGKDSQTSDIQDLLIWQAKGISMYAHRARKLGARDKEIDLFVMEALFTTVTNVNFDAKKIAEIIKKGCIIKAKAKNLYEKARGKNSVNPEVLTGAASWKSPDSLEDMEKESLNISIDTRIKSEGADITGLKELLTYGLKGTAAYADHAHNYG